MKPHWSLLIPAAAVCLALGIAQSHAQTENPTLRLAWKFTDQGSEGKGEDKVLLSRHEITVENLTASSLGPLEIRYRVYAHHEFGPDGKPEDELSSSEDTLTLPLLPPRSRQTVNSKPGHYAFGDSQLKPRDTIEGVWIKAFDANGREVGSLVSPPSLAKTFEWEVGATPASPAPATPARVVDFSPPATFAKLEASDGRTLESVRLESVDLEKGRVRFHLPADPGKAFDMPLDGLTPSCRQRLETVARSGGQ